MEIHVLLFARSSDPCGLDLMHARMGHREPGLVWGRDNGISRARYDLVPSLRVSMNLPRPNCKLKLRLVLHVTPIS